MAKIDIEKYIEELRGVDCKSPDLYSLKKELNSLSSSTAFEDFEKEASVISKDALGQVSDFGALIRMKALASEISKKSAINNKLHSVHFGISMLKNSDSKDCSQIIKALSEFNLSGLIWELNDFRAKLGELEKLHSRLMPKSLDSRLDTASRKNHLEKLSSIHNRQKKVLVAAAGLFIKIVKGKIKAGKGLNKRL